MASTKEYGYIIERDRIGILEKDSLTSKWKSVSESDKEIRLFCTALAPHFSAKIDESSHIPSQFHEGIVNKVISLGYKDPRNLNIDLAQYFETEYIKCTKMAKKYARTHRYSSTVALPQEF